MKKIQLIGLLLITLLLGSCSTVKKTAAVADINAYVAQYPTVVDLEVSPEKVKLSTQWISLFSTTSFETRKSNLTAELLLNAGADVLIEPQYIHEKDLFEHTLTVYGFPAKYKNFRKATQADLDALKAGCRDIQMVSEPCCQKQNSPKARKHKRFFGLF